MRRVAVRPLSIKHAVKQRVLQTLNSEVARVRKNLNLQGFGSNCLPVSSFLLPIVRYIVHPFET